MKTIRGTVLQTVRDHKRQTNMLFVVQLRREESLRSDGQELLAGNKNNLRKNEP